MILSILMDAYHRIHTKNPQVEQISNKVVWNTTISKHMKTVPIIVLTLTGIIFIKTDSKIDFGNSAGKTKDWYVISDNVMGGVTTSKLEYSEISMILSGELSLKN